MLGIGVLVGAARSTPVAAKARFSHSEVSSSTVAYFPGLGAAGSNSALPLAAWPPSPRQFARWPHGGRHLTWLALPSVAVFFSFDTVAAQLLRSPPALAFTDASSFAEATVIGKILAHHLRLLIIYSF
jgi:hypothetical protein